jgi:hypothetical protein
MTMMNNLSTYLRFRCRIVIEVLKNEPMETPQLPTTNKIDGYIAVIAEKHPNLGTKKVWCTMDGLKLMLEQAPNSTIQEQFYNGWTHDHYVTSVLCFCPEGTIPIAGITALWQNQNMDKCTASWRKCSISMMVPSAQRIRYSMKRNTCVSLHPPHHRIH